MSKTRINQWKCPHCPQTSSRRWNLEVHINRRHGGTGYAIQTTSSYASSIAARQPVPSVDSPEIGTSVSPGLFNNQDYHDTNRIINRRVEEAKNNKGSLEEFQKTIHEYIRWLRPLAEFQDLLRRISPSLSQQPMASLLPQLFLASIFEANNVIGNDWLPTGYKVQSCNRCLDGNMFEPVFASIQMEALSKEMVGHYCMPKAQAALYQKQDKRDLINRVHRDLLYFLINVVNSRINLKGTQDRVLLISQELDNEFLRQYSKAMFPMGTLNRTWKKQEEFIDLGPIKNHAENDNMNKEEHWSVRATKKEGQQREKIIKIDMNELKEFLCITKATFGAFRIRVREDGLVHCFLISVIF